MPQTSRVKIDSLWPDSTFLSRLPEPLRSRLLGLGALRSLPPNHVLVHQGDPGDSVWLLLDALTKVSAQVENGNETLLAIRVSGDLIGEMAAIDGSVRSASVTTCGRAVVNQIKGPVFVEFLRQHPVVALTLSQMTVDRLRWSNQRRLDFAGYETDVCLARVILALAARHGQRCGQDNIDIGIPLTQTELGGLVGAKESTVQKALRELAAEGLVRPGHRRVIITDLPGLAAFADLPGSTLDLTAKLVRPNPH